ncbi:MAG TPA: MlaD family protein, partial [Verrucomicrobiae bacterium]|nr:MlaD family protein [Verrucomicrobiae bacterium]
MKNTLETRLGIFFALALIVAFIIMEVVGGFEIFRGGIRVRAQFNTVQELKEGDLVKMAGVEIGRVEKIALMDGKVEVTMKIRSRKAAVKTDSKAVIKFAGLLGQNFVSIDFGSSEALRLEDDQLIATVEQPDLNAIMTKLDNVASGVENLTKSLSGDSIQNLLGPFTDFLKENSPRLTAVLGNMQSISSQIAEGKGTIGRLISDETLYTSALAAVTNLNETANDIKGTLGQARNVVTEISEGKGTLGKLAKDEALYKETTTAMTNLKEILQKINQGQGSVGKLVNDESFYKNAKLSLQKLDKATEGLEDQ